MEVNKLADNNRASTIMEMNQVSYAYPGTDKAALNRLELRIPANKRIALCGHNGSGKSTLFLQLIGINRPQSGFVSWRGEPLSYKSGELASLRRRVGLVFQDPEHQLILNTAYEDISYGLRNAGLHEDEIERRAARIVQQLNLQELAHKPLHHLSLGQKKRVALAGVLALEPELVLLDEPAAYLDPLSEQRLMAELDRIHASGITPVMATHDMNMAYAWADWIFIMNEGCCILEGTPETVFREGERLRSLGLALPMVLEAWEALPAKLRGEQQAPRTLAQFKAAVKSFVV
ncbi:cobalt/nickel transport system ATP-binding protein [Paenibacillus algorifonticola]|uniref:Cobalt/nickel transport system ATP-binding protein n=1 Tax=Paenibacillus algorifonticola TaxID=684063 RepID=A0A1I2G2W7_9BACL|nr:ABC transporter ATP-binding protein [Paenibacillus algorifonticola]SFF11892.1 cobalt/nickel transport system ATP-binding protein [Paenibacillus algorifonticola]